GIDLRPHQGDDADHAIGAEDRNTQHRSLPTRLNSLLPAIVGVLEDVLDLTGLPLDRDPPHERAETRRDRIPSDQLPILAGPTDGEGQPIHLAVEYVDRAGVRLAEAGCILDDGLEDGLKIRPRAAENLEHLASRPLALAGILEITPEPEALE